MRRISIVGNSGSGKSTLGRALAERIGTDFVELGSIFHQPGWEPLPIEDFQQRVDAVTAAGSWVIDGNYRAARPLIWSRADTVIWLDLPRWRVLSQIVPRTLRRLVRREELWNGNREQWTNLLSLDPERSVIAWAWHKHAFYRAEYGQAMTDP
ncbi:MAG TPA: adenylate kinase, partial [Micromonosporaceae bacterium]